MNRIRDLYRISLLDCVSSESRVRRGKSYRIQLWLYWRRCAGAGWREVLNLARGLVTDGRGPGHKVVLDLNGVPEGGEGDGAWNIKWFQFCGCLIWVSTYWSICVRSLQHYWICWVQYQAARTEIEGQCHLLTRRGGFAEGAASQKDKGRE